MDLLEELKGLGANTEEALERFMGNAELYEKMLKKFPLMLEKSPVDADFDTGSYEDVIETVHSLKGMTGNLSLTPLYEAYTDILGKLREEQPVQAKELLKGILPVQDKFIQCIQRYM